MTREKFINDQGTSRPVLHETQIYLQAKQPTSEAHEENEHQTKSREQ